MTTYSAGIARVPSMLSARMALGNINRTNMGLLEVTRQLATNRAISRYSDAPVRAATIAELDARLELSAQRLQNLGYADSSLATLDTAMTEASDIVRQAMTIASGQVSTGSTAEERKQQATVIQSLIDSLLGVANRESISGYVFGGSNPAQRPVAEFMGGYRFSGVGGGLFTDIGMNRGVPITVGASNAVGAVSARVRSSTDLDPQLTPDTRLADLNGARGLGVSTGAIELRFDAHPPQRIDLAGADTVGDVVDRLTAAIRDYEAETGAAILGPGGVSIAGGQIAIDVPAGSLAIEDVVGGLAARDLGLQTEPNVPFSTTRTAGLALEPKLTLRTPVSAMAGLGAPLGQIRLRNNGVEAVVDLSGAQTFADIKSRIEGSGLGVRVTIHEDGSGFSVVNEVASGRNLGLAIEDVGADATASALGIRSMSPTTRIADFNDGRGVEIVDGAASPELNADFVIEIPAEPGPPPLPAVSATIDLRPEDMDTVDTLLFRINDELRNQLLAAGRPITDAEATLLDGGGIAIRLDPALSGGPVTVVKRNNSPAAEQLGLVGGAWDAARNALVGEDRATVRVRNLFTDLIDLRDSLIGNDTSGISLASEALDANAKRLVDAQALIGGYARRVAEEVTREEDRSVLDQAVRSDLRDTDYAQASTLFAMYQTQLQAALQSTALSSRLSLLDYL